MIPLVIGATVSTENEGGSFAFHSIYQCVGLSLAFLYIVILLLRYLRYSIHYKGRFRKLKV